MVKEYAGVDRESIKPDGMESIQERDEALVFLYTKLSIFYGKQ